MFIFIVGVRRKQHYCCVQKIMEDDKKKVQVSLSKFKEWFNK